MSGILLYRLEKWLFKRVDHIVVHRRRRVSLVVDAQKVLSAKIREARRRFVSATAVIVRMLSETSSHIALRLVLTLATTPKTYFIVCRLLESTFVLTQIQEYQTADELRSIVIFTYQPSSSTLKRRTHTEQTQCKTTRGNRCTIWYI